TMHILARRLASKYRERVTLMSISFSHRTPNPYHVIGSFGNASRTIPEANGKRIITLPFGNSFLTHSRMVRFSFASRQGTIRESEHSSGRPAWRMVALSAASQTLPIRAWGASHSLIGKIQAQFPPMAEL